MQLTTNQRFGPYLILSPIGSGGMGEVYRAKDTRLGRDVAMKVLPYHFVSHPERMKRLEQESRSASALNHPAIITIYDIGTVDSSPYIAMEFVNGPETKTKLLISLPSFTGRHHAFRGCRLGDSRNQEMSGDLYF